MTATRAEGRRLLAEDAAAREAGVDTEAIRRWKAMGYLDTVDTPRGPRYDRNAIRELLATAWNPPRRNEEDLTPQQASRILGVGVSTIAAKAAEGRITCHRTGTRKRRYPASEIRAIVTERDRRRDPKWWPAIPEPSR